MFNKLQIRFFRKNEKVDVELEPITTFRGPSGSGKSSLVGALKWLIFNSPSGKEYIHWDHNSSAVRLVEGNNKITRKRSTKENYYTFNKQKFEAFKTGVPDKINDLLNISPLNFHRQHAGPFWFRETSGEVSRQLNSIVNLDLIDTTLSNLDRQKREAEAEKTYIEQRIKEAKWEREDLKYIVQIDKDLKALEELSEEHQNDVENLIELADLMQLAQQYKADASKFIPDVRPLMKLHKKHKQLKSKYDTLDNLTRNAKVLLQQVNNWNDIIEQDKKELTKLIGKKCPLCNTQLKTKT